MAASARFTPSLLAHETLEDLFVCREHLVVEALDRIERAATGPERSMRLFVGPRGAGKTHLVSLIAHRARRLDGYGERFQVAWLDEDPWGIDGLDDLLREILDALEHQPRGGDDPLLAVRQAVRDRGPIVVLVENLDQILTAIGRDGQRKLRAVIENERLFLFVASTTRLSTALTNQNEPFYGGYDPCDLEPFDVDQAVEMLQRLARRNGDERLAGALDTPAARRRLTAVNHLAGGQPRVWALLASGLTIEGLDELVDALLTRFDDLTPYYQEQMRHLSGQERKVVRALSDAPGSLSVGQIAQAARLDEKSAARALTGLRRQGWARRRQGPIVAKADGRLSYYDLAEPLARLAFQIKAAQGRPVRTVVEFLKHWFTAEELEPLGTDPSVDAYLTIAGTEARADPWARVVESMLDPAVGEISPTTTMFTPPFIPDANAIAASLASLDDALAGWQRGDPSPLLAQPAPITALMDEELASDPDGHRIRLTLARFALDVAQSEDWCVRVEQTFEATEDELHAEAARVAAVWHLRRGAVDLTNALVLIGMRGATAGQLFWLGGRLLQFGGWSPALQVLDSAARLARTAAELLHLATTREAALLRAGQAGQIVDSWVDAVNALPPLDLDPSSHCQVRLRLAHALYEAASFDEAEQLLRSVQLDLEHHLGDAHPETLNTRSNMANVAVLAGDRAGGIEAHRVVLADRIRHLGPDHPDISRSDHNLAFALSLDGQHHEARELLEARLAQSRSTSGPAHPDTLKCMALLGVTLGRAGEWARAADVEREVLEARISVLGPRHPDTLQTQFNLAVALWELDQRGEAIALASAAAADLATTLGPEHPLAKHAMAFASTLPTDRALDRGEVPLGDDALGAEEGAELADE